MNVDPEIFVLSALDEMGLKASKLAEGDTKTPDVIVEQNGVKILIEVKSKFDDPEYEEIKRNRLLNKEIVTESFSTTRKNSISNSVRRASDQLKSKKEFADYYLIWLVAVESRLDIKMEQFESTLYGSSDMLDWGPNGDNILRPCFYFGNSDFYNFRHILDGAVLSTFSEGKFCINNLSPRYSNFKSSFFLKKFGSSIVDPIEYEKVGKGYLVDSDIDRSDQKSILEYIRKKYGRPNILECNLDHHSGTILINK